LNRKNLLRRCLSLKVLKKHTLKKHKDVAAPEGSPNVGKLYVNTEEVLQKLDVLHKESEYEHKLLQSLSKNPILHLSYEDSFSSPESLQAMARQVFEFLEVPPIEETSNQRKTLSNSLDQIVENYEELVEALQTTRYAQYLD
ncbi:MAG: hypothetical protein AAFY11_04685, partial [Cyanobacteria bacterium J06641_5]